VVAEEAALAVAGAAVGAVGAVAVAEAALVVVAGGAASDYRRFGFLTRRPPPSASTIPRTADTHWRSASFSHQPARRIRSYHHTADSWQHTHRTRARGSATTEA